MVLAEIDVDNIYVVCGYTDMRKSINGLTAIIVQQYQMRPNDRCLFLFCGRRADRMKALLWEGDGFLLLRIKNYLKIAADAYGCYVAKSTVQILRLCQQ